MHGNQKRLKWCRVNVKIERAARLKNQKFRPKDDELLQDWLADSERYTKGGERLARIIRVLHPENRQYWFTDEAFVSIRHIIFGFNIPTRRFGSLLSAFSVLLLGTIPPIANFPDKRTLNSQHL